MSIKQLRKMSRLSDLIETSIGMQQPGRVDSNDQKRLAELKRKIVAEASSEAKVVELRLRIANAVSSKSAVVHGAVLREIVVIKAKAAGRI